MKEALNQKLGDTDVPLTGRATLDAQITLIVLRTPEVKQLIAWSLIALPNCESLCCFLRFLDVSALLEIKDKINLSNINGSQQKLLSLGKAAWPRWMEAL